MHLLIHDTAMPLIATPPLPPFPFRLPPQVFDLGADGKAAPSKAAESTEFLQDVARALGGRDVFGRGGALCCGCCCSCAVLLLLVRCLVLPCCR